MEAVANPAGQPLARVEKRLADDRPCQIDCTKLLAEHELLVKVLSVDSDELPVGGARTRNGKLLVVHLASGGVVPSRPGYRDYPVGATVQTTQGVLRVAFEVRVHKV